MLGLKYTDRSHRKTNTTVLVKDGRPASSEILSILFAKLGREIKFISSQHRDGPGISCIAVYVAMVLLNGKDAEDYQINEQRDLFCS